MKHRGRKVNNSNNAGCIFKKQKRNQYWNHLLNSQNDQQEKELK